MNFVGIDLHKKTISICVVDQERTVVDRKRFYGREPERISGFLERLGPFQAVVEATAGYERLVSLIEPPADRFVLDQLLVEWRTYTQQLAEADKRLATFAKEAPVKEAEARAILDTIPAVGPVTIDVVIGENRPGGPRN